MHVHHSLIRAFKQNEEATRKKTLDAGVATDEIRGKNAIPYLDIGFNMYVSHSLIIAFKKENEEATRKKTVDAGVTPDAFNGKGAIPDLNIGSG